MKGSDLPNFERVTIAEVIAEAGPFMQEFVDAENAARAKAKAEYEAASVEVAGETLTPGDIVTITYKERWGSLKPRRHINCAFVKQEVRSWGYGESLQREQQIVFIKYGASNGGRRTVTLRPEEVQLVVRVTTIPDWIKIAEERRVRLAAEKVS